MCQLKRIVNKYSMFNNPPKILAHKSSLTSGNFVLPEYILNKGKDGVNLFHRYCPHRMYPLHSVGEHVKEITCKFHNFKWSEDGTPINNPKKLNCGTADIGHSGLLFKNFVEPDHQWVKDLANENHLQYSHSMTGSSKGSALWMMEIQTDLLHINHRGVHPRLSTLVNLDNVKMYEGDNWVLQTHSDGWWLIVYPWTFIEWSPGCLGINTVTPNDASSEFGFTWLTQFYLNPSIPEEKKIEFATLEDVFREDVQAVEQQKGKHFPLSVSVDRLEDHCVHFGKWVNHHRAN